MPGSNRLYADINALSIRNIGSPVDDDTEFKFEDGTWKKRKEILEQLEKEEELRIGNYIKITKKNNKVNFHLEFPEAKTSLPRNGQFALGALATIPYIGLFAAGIAYMGWVEKQDYNKQNYEFQANTKVQESKFFKEVVDALDVMSAICEPEMSEMVVGPSTSPSAVFMREYMRSQGIPIKREAPLPGTKEYGIWMNALQQVEDVKQLKLDLGHPHGVSLRKR